MDRASDSGSEGWGFESLLACQQAAAPVRGGGFLFVRPATATAPHDSEPRTAAVRSGTLRQHSPPEYPKPLCEQAAAQEPCTVHRCAGRSFFPCRKKEKLKVGRKMLDKQALFYYNNSAVSAAVQFHGGIAQLVEHPVHTRVVICSNQIAATRPVGQVVKTPPFHGGNMGSSPVRVTKKLYECICVRIAFLFSPAAGVHTLLFRQT